MTVFPFRCDSCGFDVDIEGHVGQPPEPVGCLAFWSEWACVGTMRRVYTPLQASAFPGSHKLEYGR